MFEIRMNLEYFGIELWSLVFTTLITENTRNSIKSPFEAPVH